VPVEGEPHDSGTLGEALEAARPVPTAGVKLARARFLREQFGDDAPGATIGRYLIIERLGAGGMGVVHAAYDPELRRTVALKLIPVPERNRADALDEARALAKLEHEHVVRIHDVGSHGEDIYLVMERVQGTTLRTWVRDRHRAAIVEAYRQAGVALAAAHDAGLVHRDFKPDNAMVGDNGRVRLVDFGLACEAASDDAVDASVGAAGTPRYMAPEQAAGASVTPAADQYSFCVALAEALEGLLEPPPRWLAAIIERGRATEPSARFSSMKELLRALSRDRARLWRRRATVAAVAGAVAAVAFMFGRTSTPPAVVPAVCAGAELELEAAWQPSERAAALSRLDGLGPFGRAIRPRLAADIDDHSKRWIAARRNSCLEHARGWQSDRVFDLRSSCLTRSRDGFAAVGALLAHTNATALVEAPRAVASLVDPESCADVTSLLSNVEPPLPELATAVAKLESRLEDARIRLRSGRYAEASERARAIVADARGVGYAPVLAAALLVAGHTLITDNRDAAVPLFAEASDIALAAHADALAVEAWARRAWAAGLNADPRGALNGFDVIERIAKRTPSAHFARALLYNNLGGIELARNRRGPARTAFQRALAEANGLTGAEAVELINARVNLAIVTDDRTAADKLFAETIAQLSRLLGADHPDVLLVRWIRGTSTIERVPDAIAYLTRVCRALELHIGLDGRLAECWAEIGYLEAEREAPAAAISALERGIARFDPKDVPPEPAGLLELLRGNPRAAALRCATALAAQPPKVDDEWWVHLARGVAGACLGRSLRAAGAHTRARLALEAAIAELASVVRDHPATAYELRLGRARAELAFIAK
jgi:eukaryotic-like serine/threonine-protein kinase